MFEPLVRISASSTNFDASPPWARHCEAPDGTLSDENGSACEKPQADQLAAAYQRGRTDGLAEAAAAADVDREVLATIAAHLAVLADRRDAVEQGLLASCIAQLLNHIVGETGPTGDTLASRATNLLVSLRDNVSATALHCHPDDAALLGDHCAGLPVVASTLLPRGTVRLSTDQGWVEDSIDDRLARVTGALLSGGSQ